jgi:hypothetical protein
MPHLRSGVQHKSNQNVNSTLWWTGPNWLSKDWKSHVKENLIKPSEDISLELEGREKYIDFLHESLENCIFYTLLSKCSRFS